MRQISAGKLVEEAVRRTGLDEKTVREVLRAVTDTVGGSIALSGWADITEFASFADGRAGGAETDDLGRRVLVSAAEMVDRRVANVSSSGGTGVLIAREGDPWAVELAALVGKLGYRLAVGETFERALAASPADERGEPGALSFVMVGPSIDDEAYAALAHSLKLELRTAALPIVLGRHSLDSLLTPRSVQIMPDGTFDSPAGAARLLSAEAARWRDGRAFLSRRVTLRSPSDEESVRKLRDMLEAFYTDAFEDRTESYKTLSAFREAIDNGANHGNGSSPDRYLTVTLLRDEETLALDVKDEGSGFNYERALQATRADEAAEVVRRRLERGEHGGLGIRLMAECADEIRYSDRGTRVTLVKRR